MATRTLAVWLHGIQVARLSEPTPFRLRLDFTDDALDAFGEGSRVLSLALPLSRRPVHDAKIRSSGHQVSAFVEGLLPEGNARRHIASQAGLLVTDTMGLLERVGAECAGAVQFLPEGAVPGNGHVRALSDREVDSIVADLPTYHLPEGATPQASLAGIQDKVLLVAMPDGGWGWPESGAPSTHMIKPEPLGGALPHLIQTEDWALRIARHASIPAAESRLAKFELREAIVLTRYDRGADGERLHQEDFCQALGLDPQAKYESTAESERHGPRLKRIARAAASRAHDPDAFRVALLEAVTFNVVIGNGDAHSKNYSVMINRDGSVRLAPIYDAAPTYYLDSRYKGTGHVINGKTSVDSVDVEDLVDEAASWGTSKRRARTAVGSVLERVRAAVDVIPLPVGAEQVKDNLVQLWTRRSWQAPTPTTHRQNGPPRQVHEVRSSS
jgi:serine/threonine-protein kinase HipA